VAPVEVAVPEAVGERLREQAADGVQVEFRIFLQEA
jgi:hypothetical protein